MRMVSVFSDPVLIVICLSLTHILLERCQEKPHGSIPDIIIGIGFIKEVLTARSIRSGDVDTDHCLVSFKMRVLFENVHRSKTPRKVSGASTELIVPTL